MRKTSLKIIVAFLVLAILPLLPMVGRPDYLAWLTAAVLLGGYAVTFDFTSGYIKVANFGYAAFAGVGGYASAIMTVHMGVSPFLTMFVGAAVAALIGLGMGVITLRLNPLYACVVAWFVGLALMRVARNLTGVTRGAMGMICEPFFNTASGLPDYYVILGLVCMTYVVLLFIVRSRAGLAFKAIGQNMDAARASGVNPTRYRILNFTVSCAFAGLLGSFYAAHYGVLTPEVMAVVHTVEVMSVAFVGGQASLWGALVIAFPYIILRNELNTRLTGMPGLAPVLLGLVLIVVMVFYSGGFARLWESMSQRIRSRRSGGVSQALVGHAPDSVTPGTDGSRLKRSGRRKARRAWPRERPEGPGSISGM